MAASDSSKKHVYDIVFYDVTPEDRWSTRSIGRSGPFSATRKQAQAKLASAIKRVFASSDGDITGGAVLMKMH